MESATQGWKTPLFEEISLRKSMESRHQMQGEEGGGALLKRLATSVQEQRGRVKEEMVSD